MREVKLNECENRKTSRLEDTPPSKPSLNLSYEKEASLFSSPEKPIRKGNSRHRRSISTNPIREIRSMSETAAEKGLNKCIENLHQSIEHDNEMDSDLEDTKLEIAEDNKEDEEMDLNR